MYLAWCIFKSCVSNKGNSFAKGRPAASSDAGVADRPVSRSEQSDFKIMPLFCTVPSSCSLFSQLCPIVKLHLGTERMSDCLCAEPMEMLLYCQLQHPH